MKHMWWSIFLLFLVGCTNTESLSYVQYQQHKAHAELLQHRAAILAMYRECLEHYRDEPTKGKTHCEHYTQALYSVDLHSR